LVKAGENLFKPTLSPSCCPLGTQVRKAPENRLT
jgi:hypothetical protein